MLISSAAALGLAATSFGLMGASAPAAEAGLFCQAKISSSKAYVYSVCKGTSSNHYNEVRAIAYCDDKQTYGPWVKGSIKQSRAYCSGLYAAKSGAVQLR